MKGILLAHTPIRKGSLDLTREGQHRVELRARQITSGQLPYSERDRGWLIQADLPS